MENYLYICFLQVVNLARGLHLCIAILLSLIYWFEHT